MGGYRGLFDASVADPTTFWADAAQAVSWTRDPRQVLDDSTRPSTAGFPTAN